MEGNRLTEKATLRKEIRDYIQQQIASGRFKPGDRIVETQMARELGVSQAPVREAILELAAMGLLEERPYSGSFIRKLTAADIEDIYNTRAFLDEYAARRARDEAENPHDFAEKDIACHAMVVEAAGSPALKKVWDSLRLVEWTSLSVAVTRNTLPELAKQHWQIFRLLERHADHTAGAYMFLHIKNFGDELKQHYEKLNGNILPLPGSDMEKERTT